MVGLRRACGRPPKGKGPRLDLFVSHGPDNGHNPKMTFIMA